MKPEPVPPLILEKRAYRFPVFYGSELTPEIRAYLEKYGLGTGGGYGIDESK